MIAGDSCLTLRNAAFTGNLYKFRLEKFDEFVFGKGLEYFRPPARLPT